MPDVLERTLQPTRRTLGDVDPAQPFDTTHPLTDGLEGFWLPLPRLVGGSKLYDLSAYGRHGAFSPDLPSSAWGQRAEWEYSTVEFDGTNGKKITHPSMPTTGEYTLIGWVYLFDLNNDYALWQWGGAGTGANHLLWMDAGDAKGWRFLDQQAGSTSTQNAGAKAGVVQMVTVTYDGQEYALYTDDSLTGTVAGGNVRKEFRWGQQNPSSKPLNGELLGGVFLNRAAPLPEIRRWREESQRGFPDLLRRRDSVGLLGGGGGTGGISGSFALTDAGETFSATGQAKVSGTLSVTGGGETLTVNGATKVSGTASITEAAEQISASGTVITTGSVSITDDGEVISAVSSLQDITGTAQITDAGEEVSATGEIKIAGTATLNDGTEEIVIIGQNDVTGSLSFADLAAEIAATGSVEVQGSLALTDAEETITARERVPARLASVDVRLEDIIVVHATLEDTLTVDAKLTD